ncbi:3-hydroxyisobutyrate dehydrogenase [Alicyclobacillus sacchari]|uniref:3-hydroxyisobutyrate dehydrogenase n=1 Tax=Alicyclobacillus sacchari TaxID=392010 RepID=A0A4R8LV10_9BACL|nr:DUF1932 domain-containing protein [Alicyclobacillus sacchari]TDY50655.1 3-hydroxyisobutyrate dehydrogenase [Alicyclobacillus sacchari]GMA55625.1 dehydrogenase [Alicyclobacillus sacchari]
MRLGFIGFGEAASTIALGLSETGLANMIAYDAMRSIAMEERARAARVQLVDSPRDVCTQADVVLSMVTASVAADVARTVAPYLSPRQVYADLNSCSPAVKREIGKLVNEAQPKALYASVAVMSAVGPHRHLVPMVTDGPGAEAFAAALTPYGCNIRVLAGEIGSSAALKMCRSTVLKGLEALFIEALVAAEMYGVTGDMLASLDASFPQHELSSLAWYLVERNMQHGQRRAHEMDEAARTLASAGVEPLVAEGAAKRLHWSAERQKAWPKACHDSPRDAIHLLAKDMSC